MFNQQIDIDKIKSLVGEDIKISLHLSETFDPFVLDSIMRKAHLETFKRALHIAEALDAFLINMHLSKGIHFTLPDKKLQLYNKYKDKYMIYVEDFCKLIEDISIPLCIENTGIHNIAYIQEASDRLLATPGVYLTYDIGHDITSDYKDKAYYDSREDKIRHYHIHDGTPEKNHLELFTGQLDIELFLNQASSKGATCVIEVKSSDQLIRSVKKLEDI